MDSIRPKCVELRRVCDDFTNEAQKKNDILSKSLQIHRGIDKVREEVFRKKNALSLENGRSVESNRVP